MPMTEHNRASFKTALKLGYNQIWASIWHRSEHIRLRQKPTTSTKYGLWTSLKSFFKVAVLFSHAYFYPESHETQTVWEVDFAKKWQQNVIFRFYEKNKNNF